LRIAFVTPPPLVRQEEQPHESQAVVDGAPVMAVSEQVSGRLGGESSDAELVEAARRDASSFLPLNEALLPEGSTVGPHPRRGPSGIRGHHQRGLYGCTCRVAGFPRQRQLRRVAVPDRSERRPQPLPRESDQIGEVVGKSAVAVRVALHRTVAELRRRYFDDER
jgi:hypothetical protein